jgi:hypothetical protein
MKTPEQDDDYPTLFPPKCPYCNETMVPGRASVEGTFFGFLFYGFSFKHLWFKRLGQHAKKEIIVKNGCHSAGHQCPWCGAVAIRWRSWR